MSNLKYRVVAVPDLRVLTIFREIAQALEAKEPKFQASLGANVQRIGPMALDADLQATKIGEVISDDTFVLHNVTIALSFEKHAATLRLQRNDNGFDEIEVTFPPDTEYVGAGRAIAAIRKGFKAYDPAGRVDVLVGDQLAEFYRAREETLGRLERLNERIINETDAYRTRLSEEVSAHKQKLDEQAASERERLDTEFQERQTLLQERAAALEEEKKALDDRSSRHARRQHHKDLKTALQLRNQEFSLTKATIRKRWPVHALFIVLIAAAGGLLVFSAWQYFRAEAFDWHLGLRSTLTAAAFAGAVIFYIRWNDHWFERHAQEEFRLKRLDLDIDRASWVVEMALEWKEEKGTAIPEELTERLTRNLFADARSRRRPRHPGQDLASLLLSASSGLRVRIPGVGEAMVGRGGIRSLRRKARRAEPHQDDDSESDVV